jgi:hypothetical protein
VAFCFYSDSMKKALSVTVAVAIAIGVAAYWVAAPYVVMHQLQRAAQARDTEALDAHVDYPALRESLRGQVSATLADKIGALGSAIGMAVANPLINIAVQPDAVAASLRSGRWETVAATAANPPPDDVKWTYQREGFGIFVAQSKDAFVLVRHGFADWKLSGIRIAR